MMLTDAESFVRCQAVFDPQAFDRRLVEPAKFLNNYVSEHNALPTFDMINAATQVDLKDPGKLQENHYDWLLQEFETFSKHKALEAAILKSADLLEKGEYGSCEDLVKKAVQIGLQKDLGTDYFKDPRARLESIKSTNGQVSTGWANMDKRLFGGFNRGELNIFAGGSGAGKSLFLANIGVNMAEKGMNVLYLTLELSEALVSMRIDSMLTGISTKDVFKQIDDVEMKVRIIGKKSGAFQVKYMPSGKTANDTATTQVGADQFTEQMMGQGQGYVLNLSDQPSIDAFAAALKADHGAPLILVNNAGITQDNLAMRMKPAEWNAVINTNLNGVFHLTQTFMRGMMKAKFGRIINISSVVGRMGNPGQVNYAAAKAGLEGFTRALGAELASRNITVNAIAPGFIATDMTDALSLDQQTKMLERIPAARLGQPKEVAALVQFLSSDVAGYITGETIAINGGLYMS